MRLLPPLSALRIFEVAGKQQSFTVAAKQLSITPGAVSKQIKQLEDYLGIPLFVRLHHKLELTEAGQELLQSLEQSFNLMEAAVSKVRDPNQRQKLSILAPPTFATRWLASRLTDLHHRFPKLELSVHNHYSEQIRFDCEIRFGRAKKPKHFSKLLFIEQHIPVCAPQLLERSKDLINENGNLLHILHQGKKLPIWESWLKAAKLDGAFDVEKGLEFSTLDQVINSIKAGTGFAVIDKNMIRHELQQGTLVQFNQTEVNGPYGYWLDISAEHQGVSKVTHFTQWLLQQANC
ncbi:MAG: LysR family transcriptional regulator [Arenicella sp.]